MINREHKLPITRQSALLGLARSTAYYRPRPIGEADLALMRRIDELHLQCPFAGSRMLRDLLRAEGHAIGRKHVRTLMRRMGLAALYRRPNTSRSEPGHHVYPYLLRDVAITRANQVWSTDITYVPMAKGFAYLVAVIDWYSRRVLAWRLSNTMTVDFCVDALQEALARHGTPEIFNSDQGSPFTSQAFTSVLEEHGVAISMDGRGRWRDNVIIERLWRTVKYEDIYLHGYETITAARNGLKRYFAFYNGRRPHSALGAATPEQTYFDSLSLAEAA